MSKIDSTTGWSFSCLHQYFAHVMWGDEVAMFTPHPDASVLSTPQRPVLCPESMSKLIPKKKGTSADG